MTSTRRRAAIVFITAALVGLAACGASAPGSAVGGSPNPHRLTGKGATWQAVITADPGSVGVTGLALDGLGNIYLVERSNNRIAQFSLDGTLIRRWGSQGSAAGQLDNPAKVALDTQGNVYVTESTNNRVQKFSATGEPLAQWGGLGSDPGKFNFPIGIIIDAQGNLYVADGYNYRIQKLSPFGRPLASWGRDGAEPGQFHIPYDLALDTKGNLYVSEAHGNDRVQVFSPAGALIAQRGGSGHDPGKFSNPTGIAVDSGDNLYVVDTHNNRVQKMSPSGQYLAQWGAPTGHPFSTHTEMAMDEKGNIYVSDGALILRTCVVATGCS